MDLQGRPLSSGAARWIDAQFHDLGSGTGEDVRQGAQQEPMTVGTAKPRAARGRRTSCTALVITDRSTQ
jgi:hypothetical protein